MVRFKSRYIVFQIFQENQLISTLFNTNWTEHKPFIPIKLSDKLTTLTSHNLLNLIKEHVYLNFGDWGQGLIAASLNIKYYSPATHTGIIRVSRQHYRLVWAVLTFIKTIQDQPILIRVLRINGTIKKAKMFLIQRNQDLLIKEKFRKNI
ncbi:hypothetical protein PNEG_02283 [Pneumocystis murina B123]|uniref:Ribonuclease P/MRP protein subunit POP5 n=1 Tax=Pneumocystis murina (strain B123) TaxID=1069680 RepID=M7NL02_PNEMU|nr:hypothetical protein PNEG_02283 [Pneumocystis murina B123]EMR09328.1 hypothetical protein PNEG_02283 [Pneumocystis murina B123]